MKIEKFLPVRYIKDHLPFIIAFVIVLGGGAIVYVFLTSSLFRNLLFVNGPYLLSIFAVSLLPVAVLKKFNWYPQAAPLSAWVGLFAFTAFYFAFFHQPNIILFVVNIITNNITFSSVFSAFFGIIAISGVFTFFYLTMSYLSAKKDNFFNVVVDPKSYTIWIITYLLYINLFISIFNPAFQRPV